MKTGYSILLSELIESKSINYHDCEKFQIVCPSCNEPVFKVNRDNDVQYLSHYQGTKTNIELCELRVKHLKQSDFEEKAAKAREQRLQYFLKVFVGMMKSQTNETHQATNKLLKRSKGYHYFESQIMASIHDLFLNEDNFMTVANKAIDTLDKQGDTLKTSFELEKQKQISYDLFKLLMTSKATVNKKLLMRFSFSNSMSSIYGTKERQPELYEEWHLMSERLNAIAFGSKKEAIEAIEKMSRYTSSLKQGSSWNIFIDLYFMHIARSLLILPYFEYLDRQSH